MRPNIVLVVFDTARADAFEPYGAGRGASPAVAELAKRGWAAPRAYATSNWTLPSHASLFTGLMPRALGLGVVDGSPRDVLAPSSDRMLASVLHDAGYATRAASANPWISPGRGFDPGFDEFRVTPHKRRHEPTHGTKARLRWTAEVILARLDDGLSTISSWIDRWLDETTKPFFFFVNLMECHTPFLPPRPYNDLSASQRYRAAIDSRRYTWHRGALDVSIGRRHVPPRSLNRMRHLYGRAVLSMDAWLGHLFESLERRGIADDTIVIVTSDHGEGLGERGLLGHGLTLAESLLRVPLVAAGPGIGTPGELMTIADVPALIARAAELRDHPWREREGPYVTAESNGMVPIGSEALAGVIKSWQLDEPTARLIQELLRSATDGRFKLVRDDAGEHLYDLIADPFESTNVGDAHPDVAQRLREALDAAAAQDATAMVASPAAEPVEEMDDLEERMRLLGYL